MFIARTHELEVLERLYARPKFDMVVLYGRRRVGKTALIDQFVADKEALYFTALQQSNKLNLRDFTSEVARFFSLPSDTPSFSSWTSALTYVANQAQQREKPFVFVFDEFPYAALEDESLPSALQIAIDHGFNATNTMIILSGSNESFMESNVLGGKSPLYGRRTAQIKLLPFTYMDAAQFLPDCTPNELVEYYATFGGTPYYLAQLDTTPDAYCQNVINLCFDSYGMLREEPMMLLREKLRDPAIYYSVLQAIANGHSTPKAISEHAGVNPDAISSYLNMLDGLGLVRRNVPFGDNPSKSKKGMWNINDPFFSYWYHFVGPSTGAIESGKGAITAQRTAFGAAFDTYVGQQFETICLQWITNATGTDKLPLLPTQFGKWWGTNPRKKEQTDIDVVAGDPSTKTVLLGECKWRNNFNETEAVESLLEKEGLIRGHTTTYFMFFSKNPVSQATRSKYAGRVRFLDADELYGMPAGNRNDQSDN